MQKSLPTACAARFPLFLLKACVVCYMTPGICAGWPKLPDHEEADGADAERGTTGCEAVTLEPCHC